MIDSHRIAPVALPWSVHFLNVCSGLSILLDSLFPYLPLLLAAGA